MLKDVFYRAANRARTVMLPPTLMSLAYMLYRAGGGYFQDGLLTVHNSDFRKDPKFREAYALGKATGSWGRQDVEWRAYVCCWAAWSVREKDGDFVECGVNRGGLSRTVCHYVDFGALNKRFWLLDTYEGLPEHLISEDERGLGILPGGYDPCYDQVVETFRSVPGTEHLSVYQTSPELWEREAFEEQLDGAPEATGEPGKSSAGELGRLVVRVFFSAGAGLLAWSHMPVETAQ